MGCGGKNNLPKKWMRRKIDDLGVISSEMILLKRNVIKKIFLTFVSTAAAEYKNRDYFLKCGEKY